MSRTSNKFTLEVRARAVLMVLGHEGDHPSRRAVIVSISENIRCVPQTLHEWVDWLNNRRLLEAIGNIPPAEAEDRYYATLDEPAMAA